MLDFSDLVNEARSGAHLSLLLTGHALLGCQSFTWGGGVTGAPEIYILADDRGFLSLTLDPLPGQRCAQVPAMPCPQKAGLTGWTSH